MESGSPFLEDCGTYTDHFLEHGVKYPSLAIIETTSLCNLKCPMCPRTIHRSPSGDTFANMKLDLLHRLEDLFPRLDEVVLSWIGEPLIHTRLRTRSCRSWA